MYGIGVEESGTGITVEMKGEFDAYALPALRETLDDAFSSGRPAVVDLSGVTFLDLQSARELVVRSLIQAHQLAFANPSPGVLASIRALGMQDGLRTGPHRQEPEFISGA